MPVQVTLAGEGLNYNVETDVFRASQIIAFLNAPKAENVSISPYVSSSTSAPRTLISSSSGSPRKAILDANAKNNMQKIAALACYWSSLEGKNTITPADIKSLLGKAGETMPKNLARDLREAVIANYVVETDQKGEYELTEFGFEAVQEGFEQSRGVSRTKKRSARKVSSASGTREEIEQMAVTAIMEGYPDFHSLPSKGQKILWILLFADSQVAGGLSISEVAFLAHKLKESITAKSFTALNEGNVKQGYVLSKNGRWEIYQKGIDLLKSHIIAPEAVEAL